MTVAELIESLKALPPDIPVLRWTPDELQDVDNVSLVNLQPHCGTFIQSTDGTPGVVLR